jgi:glycosyltransferase involved in cell wall biosynthesis
MKILFLLPIFKNTGPGNVVLSLVKKLSAHAQAHNMSLYVVSLMPIEDGYGAKLSNTSVNVIAYSGFTLKNLYRLWRFVRLEKIDIIHNHCLLPDLVAPIVSLFSKAKNIATVHCNLRDNYQNEYQFPKRQIYYALHRLALRFSNKVVYVSESIAANKTMSVIYNGVKPRVITVQKNKDINLIFAGRLIASKNILWLLECIVSINQQSAFRYVLHIYGDGDLYSSIKQRHLEHVVMHGFVNDYLANLPDNAIMVNPSLFEGMPMAVVEALSAGLPVALSAIAPHQEIKQHIEEGVVTFDNNAPSFIQAIASLVNAHGLVAFNKTLMREKFNCHFSDENMVDKYLAVYRAL